MFTSVVLEKKRNDNTVIPRHFFMNIFLNASYKLLFILWIIQEKEIAQKKLQEVIDENVALQFEHNNMSEGYMGRRISRTSLASSQMSLVGQYTSKNKIKNKKDFRNSRIQHVVKTGKNYHIGKGEKLVSKEHFQL